MNEQTGTSGLVSTYTRLLEMDDAAALAEYHQRNEPFHHDWSPVPPASFFTTAFQRERLRYSSVLRGEGREYRFGIFTMRPADDGIGGPEEHLIGTITLTAVERGVFQNGRFGYSIDGEYTRQGIMTRSLKEVMRFAFETLRLHRLEANVIPRNIASHGVMERCGFTRIGFSPKMLLINGVWEDHVMYMILAEDFEE